MQPRGQAALEFLMTYGWAFLVMTAVIAAIVTLDPLGSGPEITSCESDGMLSCDTDKVLIDAEEDGVSLAVENTRQEAVTYDTVTVKQVGGASANATCTSPGTVRPGEPARITCPGVSIQSEDTTDITVEYKWYPASVGEAYARNNTVTVRGRPGETRMVTEGLVGYWPLNGNTYDATKHDNHGTIQGDVHRVDGVIGDAYDFTGPGNEISVSDQAIHRPTDSLTVSCWIKSEKTQPDNGASCVWKGGPNGYALEPKSDYIRVNLGEYTTLSYHPIDHGEWQHWAFTYNRTGPSTGDVKLYKNGQLVDTATGDLPSTTSQILIGRRGGHLSKSFNGSIDDVRIYNKTLHKTT